MNTSYTDYVIKEGHKNKNIMKSKKQERKKLKRK